MPQAHILYSGMVQGIGFRYTTQRLAADLKLNGWVRNVSDGRVEILAEGSQENIEKLMQQLADHFGSYIKDKEVDYGKLQESLKGFQVRG
ncbi:MAG: hypothetical protein A3D10_00410 [Omnitrophica WOR_2 bacterium RIFCSPHIGHO2_02_FULL_48_11]|nr:MAG: hypothetical protein A3D10_00410 [Omnitrophica WOR_2 bacterium RIFCSPHIGHO2_02_FULL_48_11]